MKKYVVAYLNFFDNEIEQKVVHEMDELSACLQFLGITVEQQLEYRLNSMDALMDYLSRSEAVISIVEI